MQSQFKVEFVSWQKIARLSYLLANKIAMDHYKPDIIIAIARGGYIPARLLCDYLDIYNLTGIRITHYLGGTGKTEAAKLSIPLNLDVKGMRVLLVDDVDDSGDTLEIALEHIKGFKPVQIRIAVIHHKQTSTIKPHYYAQKVIKWRWITYPWAIVEDVQGFLKKMDTRPANAQMAIDYFYTAYRIKIPAQIMDRVYRDIA